MTQKKYHLDVALVASSLAKDERVAQARQLLHEAVKDHQKRIQHIQPPQVSARQSYEEMLSTYAQYRGAKLYFPYLGSGFGNGPLVELADGSIKYDFICGIGTHYLGHSHPDLLDAGIDAALSNTVMQGHLQQNVDSLELTELLIQASGLDHCFLSSSGAMANENAFKIAFQKKYPASRVLAFERCFAGRTLTISQITDKPEFRRGLPLNVFVDYLPFFDPQRPEESTKQALDTLKKYLHRYPNQYALMCFEFVQGEGGFYNGNKEFFQAIMAILKEHKIAIFADEVQTFARTPELFAFQYYGLEPYIDIATIGKLSQVCATLYRKEYQPQPGLLSQTFTSSTSAIKASVVILRELLENRYFGPEGKITKLHTYILHKLETLAKRYPGLIEGPYGIGCMIAFTPFGGDNQKVTKFVQALFENGVISFIAGAYSQLVRVRFLIPAGVVTFKHIDEVLDIVEQTLVQQAEL